MTQVVKRHIKKNQQEQSPLYEIVVRAVKSEMNKNVWIRNKTLIGALKGVQSKFAKYWRKTGDFPSDNIAASILADAISERKLSLKKCRESEIKTLEGELFILKQFVPEKFEYKEIDIDNMDPCQTNVRWELHHNPQNVTITDKRQLRSLQ